MRKMTTSVLALLMLFSSFATAFATEGEVFTDGDSAYTETESEDVPDDDYEDEYDDDTEYESSEEEEEEPEIDESDTEDDSASSLDMIDEENESETEEILPEGAATETIIATRTNANGTTNNGTSNNGTANNGTALVTMRRTGVTVSNNVNFRHGPNGSYGNIGRIPVNTNIRITGRQGNWYRIVHAGTTGWVGRSSVAQTRQMAVVTGHNIPVRANHDAGANILTRLSRGARVTIMERTASWAQVTVNGRTGWVRANQLNIANGRRPARTRSGVNLYTRPGNGTVRRRLNRHQQVMVLQRTLNGNGNGSNGGWTQVEIRQAGGTQRGWVRTNQIQNRNQGRRIRGNGSVAVRTGPGSNFSRSRSISRNTRVIVLAESGGWSHVRFSQGGARRHGWVANNRLTRITSQAGFTAPTATGWIVSGFGPRWGHFHRGIDIRSTHRAPILAAADGRVVTVRYNAGGFGHYIVLRHNIGGATYYTLYAHLRSRPTVRVGSNVRAGQQIGVIGGTGSVGAPGNIHLHFEIHRNRFSYTRATAIDPARRLGNGSRW